MCMSLLGAIGHLMKGSGILSVFEQIYAELSVTAILSGKEMSRGTRAHTLLYRTLTGLIISKMFAFNRETSFQSECPDLPFIVQELKDMVSQLMSKDISEKKLQSSTPFLDVVKKVTVFKESHSGSKTSLLWLQYMHAIEMLLRFLKAERSRNWMLHLQTFRKMIPFFAASGHHLYAKSSYMYLKTMSELPNTHSNVQQMFQNGFHTIRRSDKFWAGLSRDLVIEQTLMQSVKISGRLTRGRGMDELQRSIWLLSTAVTPEVNRAMQEFTGVRYKTSDQHKDLSLSRIQRDYEDV